MDEETGLITCPWPVEPIPGNEYLSRHVLASGLIKESGRRFPSESDFILRETEDGLSHYWNRHISLEDIYITIALTHNAKGAYKEYTSFKIFQIENNYIKSLNDSLKVEHNPAFFGNPAPVGSPNNRSHSLVIFPKVEEEELLQIRINLATFCQKNYETSYREFDVKSIKEKVVHLREKTNDTPYHRLEHH